jgi:DNA-binding transcriptional regulator YiaG
MPSTTLPKRKRRRRFEPTGLDYPYTLRLRDGRTIVVEIPGKWVTTDRDGTPAFLPPAVEMIDRIRVLVSSVSAFSPPTPGYIATLRKALGLTQRQLGERLGVDKMTVYRWERGTVKPGGESLAALERVRRQAARKGVVLPA